jgi:cytochrome c-type biogenesis protein CcmH
MRPAAALALVLLAAVIAGAAAKAAPIPVPRFKPSPEELANFGELSEAARRAMLEAVVAGLIERVAAREDDVEGWLRLGRAHLALDQRPAAIRAHARAAALAPHSPTVLKAYAQSLLRPTGIEGAPRVGDEAVLVFQQVAALDPDDPEPFWYLGLAALQEGEAGEAARLWAEARARLEPWHPYHARIEAGLAELAPRRQLPPRYRPYVAP